VWGHSEGFDTEILRTVPWHIIDSDQRRNIVENSPVNNNEKLDQKEVKGRLEALGYTE